MTHLESGIKMEKKTKCQEPPRSFQVDLGKICLEDKELTIYPDHSPASILLCYTRACGFSLRFLFTKTDSGSGFASTVFIEDFEHLTGYGQSKMAAKQQASKRCLKIMLPEIKKFWPEDEDDLEFNKKVDNKLNLEGLDPISVSYQLHEIYPYPCLRNCLRQNFGQNGLDINKLETTFIFDKNTRHWHCKMKIQEYEAEGTSTKRRSSREFAAHKILMQMHPLVRDFAGILQIYGKHSATSLFLELAREKRQKVLDLQLKDQRPAPINVALLAHLREEMIKLHDTLSKENEESA